MMEKRDFGRLIRPAFPINDQRRVPLENALGLRRKCDACGHTSRNLTPVIDRTDTTPNDPPIVCVDFMSCCERYRMGTTPMIWAMVVLGGKA